MTMHPAADDAGRPNLLGMNRAGLEAWFEDRGERRVETRRARVETQVQSGMDPEEVGRIVLAAVKEGRFYILTHPWQEMIRGRMEAILDGASPHVPVPPGMTAPDAG